MIVMVFSGIFIHARDILMILTFLFVQAAGSEVTRRSLVAAALLGRLELVFTQSVKVKYTTLFHRR